MSFFSDPKCDPSQCLSLLCATADVLFFRCNEVASSSRCSHCWTLSEYPRDSLSEAAAVNSKLVEY